MMRYIFLSIFTLSALTAKADEKLMQDGIEHVVVLMLENRSYDNILAWLYSDDDAPKAFIPKTTDPVYKGLTEDTLHLYTNTLKDSKGNVIFSSHPY